MPKYIELTADLVDKSRRASGTINMYSIALAQMLENIDQLPAADVTPVVHGRWNDMDGYKTRKFCSVCGWDVPEYGKLRSKDGCGAACPSRTGTLRIHSDFGV